MTKPKDPKEKSIHRKDIKFGVRVGLAEDEREPVLKKLLNLMRKHDRVRVDSKDVQAKFRKELKDIKDMIDEQAITLEQGHEEMMDCQETKNFATGKLTVRRKDTGKVVFERDLTDEDRQMDMGESSDGKDDEDGGDDTEDEAPE